MRESTEVVGRSQSVGRIGSQTTRTFRLGSWIFSSDDSVAEAPCRHTGHVGESSRTRRTFDGDASNAFWKSERFWAFRESSSGCPVGVR